MTDAKDGQYAEKLDMTRRTDGDAKLIPIMDSANCSPTVTADRPYVLGVSYKSTAPTFLHTLSTGRQRRVVLLDAEPAVRSIRHLCGSAESVNLFEARFSGIY